MKSLAAQGRTVFVSSHLMSEMENTADHLIVIGRGRIIADCTVREFIEKNSRQIVRARTPQGSELAELVARQGGNPVPDDTGDGLLITDLSLDRVGDLAFDNGIRLHELSVLQASLEQAFMELTKDSVEYHAAVPAATRTG
jgi:ABC-2 type transport system ATP-binding protein